MLGKKILERLRSEFEVLSVQSCQLFSGLDAWGIMLGKSQHTGFLLKAKDIAAVHWNQKFVVCVMIKVSVLGISLEMWFVIAVQS